MALTFSACVSSTAGAAARFDSARSRTVDPSSPEASTVPSGLNAGTTPASPLGRDRRTFSCCPRNTLGGAPGTVMFHSWIVPSMLPDASVFPFGPMPNN